MQIPRQSYLQVSRAASVRFANHLPCSRSSEKSRMASSHGSTGRNRMTFRCKTVDKRQFFRCNLLTNEMTKFRPQLISQGAKQIDLIYMQFHTKRVIPSSSSILIAISTDFLSSFLPAGPSFPLPGRLPFVFSAEKINRAIFTVSIDRQPCSSNAP